MTPLPFERVMVVAPHPDDETIGAGGLLARHDGWSMVAVVGGTTHAQSHEALEAVRRLDVDVLRFAESSRGPEFLSDREIVGWLDEQIEAERPDLLLIPSQSGYHQEHRRVASLAVSAARPRGGRGDARPMSVWYYESPSDVSSPAGAWSPTVYVALDQSDVDAKLSAMACYESQVRPHPSERSLATLEALATLRGGQVGVPYAEAFAPRRMVL